MNRALGTMLALPFLYEAAAPVRDLPRMAGTYQVEPGTGTASHYELLLWGASGAGDSLLGRIIR